MKKNNTEHECDKQRYRIAKYDGISGNGWFLDAEREKVDIIYCPYCGERLETQRERWEREKENIGQW
jgi:hypothetical protein